jgi:hypothetical protein
VRNKKAAHKLAAELSDADLTSWDYSGWVRRCQCKNVAEGAHPESLGRISGTQCELRHRSQHCVLG